MNYTELVINYMWSGQKLKVCSIIEVTVYHLQFVHNLREREGGKERRREGGGGREREGGRREREGGREGGEGGREGGDMYNSLKLVTGKKAWFSEGMY